MNKIKTTIGQRFFQVLIVISFLLIVSIDISILSTGNIDMILGFFFGSLVPLIIICAIQYIVYGDFHPFYLFKNEIKKDES